MEELLRENFKKFRESVETGQAICALKSMIYLSRTGMLDLTDKRFCMLYLLRYGYALAWEYQRMLEIIVQRVSEADAHVREGGRPVYIRCMAKRDDILENVVRNLNREMDAELVLSFEKMPEEERLIEKNRADILFYPCSLTEVHLQELPQGKYIAFSGHSRAEVEAAERSLQERTLIDDGQNERRPIPWEYPEEIAEYLWNLNEHCINFTNGHNCFGVCARQLDVPPVRETGQIVSRIYR